MRALGTVRRITTSLAASASLVLFSIAGCSIDENSNPTERCGAGDTCSAGNVCYRGYCIPGTALDGGFDASMGLDADGGRDTAGCVPTGAETCNGMDDDCDGTTDNLPRTEATECNNGEVGACATAHLACPTDGGTTPVCRRDVEPTAESCNGQDDDCDRQIDENSERRCYPDGTTGCTVVGGVYVCDGACGAGLQLCVDGAYGACQQARTPGTEACTTSGMIAADEDCDRSIDEECPGCTDGIDCYPGDVRLARTGACDTGTLDCATHSCLGFGMPSDETCANAGSDNDCNGVEDDVPGTGVACFDDEALGVCRMGVMACDGSGAVTCDPTDMIDEACNELDDDCNGTVDDGFDPATDEMNCGGCGEVCPTGLSCWDSACRNGASDPMFCGATASDDGEACAAGETCCGGTCIDTDVDTDNCGACGRACDGGDTCCGGDCVDTDYDEGFCGDCTTTCTGATPQCCTGTCSAADTCNLTPADCTAMGLTLCDGACVDPLTDEAYCGAAGTCGVECAAGSLCCGGACVPNDEAHCGRCDVACDGGDLCCDGACVDSNNAHCGDCTTRCGTGLECCGTECSTRNTETHCGTCGNACADGQACSAGHCCAEGLTWCGSACFDLQNDDDHCGNCTTRCQPALILFPTHCEAGSCVL